MAGERRLYLERNCRLPESPAHRRRRNREGPASSKGLNSQRGFGPAVEPRRKSRPRSTSLHGSSPCKCQRLSTLRWDRLPPSRPSTKSGARAGGRRLSDRRLHRWLAGTSASAPSSHGAADLLGLNRAHICVRNPINSEFQCPEVVCPACGKTTQARRCPTEVKGQFGAQLTALSAYLTVGCRLPRRVVRRLLEGALQIPISLGSTHAAWAEASEAVAGPCVELEQALPHQPVVHSDETGHRTNGAKRYLWALVAPLFVLYRIAPTRGAVVLRDLLGPVFTGILCSDRYVTIRAITLGCCTFAGRTSPGTC